jgi:hypothetical protein
MIYLCKLAAALVLFFCWLYLFVDYAVLVNSN